MAAELSPQDHLRRITGLERDASNFRNIWTELQQYVAPWRDPVNNQTSRGQKQTDRIFDSTASNLSVLAASAVHGLTMPAGTKWFSVAHPDPKTNEIVPVGRWLEGTQLKINAAFDQSNLAQESQELITDLLIFGTGCMYWELQPPSALKAFPGLRFRTMPPGSYVIAENADGLVDTVYRKFTLSAEAIQRRWGADSGQEVMKKLAANQPDARFTIVHGVWPRDPRSVTPGNDLRIPVGRRPYAEIWMVAGESTQSGVGALPAQTPSNNAHVLSKDGRFEFPFLVPRWRKMSGETYGRSPGIDALPDIRTLNKAVELRLKAWSLAIAPPMAVSDRGVIGEVRLVPFGRINTRGNPREAFETLDIGANFNVANFQEEQLRDQIRRSFFVDQLQAHASQGLSPKSATEVSISFELMMRILGPVASRLSVELLAPLIRGTFKMMQRTGGLEEPPGEVLIDGDIAVVYQGPLARAQSIQEVDAITRLLQVVLPIAESHPEVMAWYDFSEMGKVIGEAVSVPKSVMKTRKQVEQEQAAQQEAAGAQQEQSDLLGSAEILNKIAPAAIAGQRAQG